MWLVSLPKLCSRSIHSLLVLSTLVNEILCLSETTFFAGFLCDVQDKLSHGCSDQLSSSATGRIECLVQCRNDPDCIGFHVDQHENCFIHRDCPVLRGCVEMDSSLGFLSKNCAHGGAWKPSENRCDCVNGWVGETCQELPHTCQELGDFYHEQTVLRAYLNFNTEGLGLAPVLCRVIPSTGLGITLLQNNGDANFNRTWEEYRAGFVVDDTHFWSGLDSWHVMSRAGYNHVTISINFKNLGVLEQHYYDFYILDSSEDFRFYFSYSESSASGDLHQFASFNKCLDPYQNAKFSVFDHDLDGSWSQNCASIFGSGWWFKNGCGISYCNLFGRGPKHWNTITPNQRIHFFDFEMNSIMTPQEFQSVYIYLDKLSTRRNLF